MFAGLNGLSSKEIEDEVLQNIRNIIVEYDINAEITAVKVYGSRTRDNLYNRYSDLDVVVAYEGDIREDDFFNVLNNSMDYIYAPNGRLKLDVNPIRKDKSGTIEAFMQKAENYLDEKEKIKTQEKADKINIICLDVETTGFDPYGDDEILQLSIIDGDYNTLFNEYLKPEKKNEWKEAHQEFVADKITIKEYLSDIQEIINKADVIVGYDIGFDLSFLDAAGIKISERTVVEDVMLDFASIYGEWNDYYQQYKWQKLTTCATYFGFDWELTGAHAHDSLADCHATLYSYYKIENFVDKESIYINVYKDSLGDPVEGKSLKQVVPIPDGTTVDGISLKDGWFLCNTNRIYPNMYNDNYTTIEIPEGEKIKVRYLSSENTEDNNKFGEVIVKAESLAEAIQNVIDTNYINRVKDMSKTLKYDGMEL